MGLKEDAADAAEAIIDGFGNLIPNVTYYVTGTPTSYDVDNDQPVDSDTPIVCKGALYRTQIGNNEYFKADLVQTFIAIAGKDLGLSIVPKETDYIVADGTRYEIKNIKNVARGAAFIFNVRAP